jgi:predicted nucleic acid-binding protein
MSGDFLDTNVFVYLFDPTAPHKRSVAEQLIENALRKGSAVISFQVVQETLNVVTQKLSPALTQAEADRFLESVLAPLWSIMPTRALYESALYVQARHGFHFYDSLIVASAQAGGCSRLLSEDLQHGQRIGQTTIHNPFEQDIH